MKRYLALLLAAMLLCGCSRESPVIAETTAPTATSPTVTVPKDHSEMFTNRDLNTDYTQDSAVVITLRGNSAEASSNSVKISGTTVQITEEADYFITGTLEDGMLVVNAPKDAKIQLIFSDAHITNSQNAALYISQADKVVLTLAQGSENSLISSGGFQAIDGNNIDAALYSKEDLTINGSGSLSVSSAQGHGIVSKDDLVITGGDIHITAASHALDANDSVRFANATLTATAGKDGIHAENNDDASLGFVYISSGTVTIDAQGDGISAGSTLDILGGDFNIVTGGGYENGQKQSSDSWGGFPGGGMGGGGMGGGGRPGGRSAESSATTSASTDSTSMKGLKATTMEITGGSFVINSADDALHSNGSMTVAAGTFQISTGDDALHAEDTLTVSGGTIQIDTCYEGLEALHIAVSGGDIRLVASDDGLNAAGGTDSSGFGGRDGMFGGHGGGMGGMGGNSDGTIVISGGKLYINASGDGIDANGTLEITGGHTTVVGPTQGDTATLDYDISATISGGTFIGTGASSMAQTIQGSSQGVFAVSTGRQAAGTLITLTDKNGNTVISYTPELSFQVVILSSPDIISGESYTITVGSQSAVFEAE